DFRADFLARLEAHHHQLKVVPGVEHTPKVAVVQRRALDVVDVTLHALGSLLCGHGGRPRRVLPPGWPLRRGGDWRRGRIAGASAVYRLCAGSAMPIGCSLFAFCGRSKRSAFMTLVQALTKSFTNFSWPPFSA